MAKDATAVAADWAAKLAAAGPKAQAGAESVRTAPGAAAARQVAVWQANVAASASKYARNVAAVSRDEWVNAYVTKGIPRLATGAAAAQQKMANFLQKFLPFLDNAKAGLPARGTYEQNKARMVAMVDAVHKFQK